MTLEPVAFAATGLGAGADVWAALVAVGAAVAFPGWTVTDIIEISGIPDMAVKPVIAQAGRMAIKPTRITASTFFVVNVGYFIKLPP